MANIHDVARKAGVAPITVSRVINNSGYVTQAVRDKVNAAVEELGYVPNTLARSLRSRRTNTLALILSDITNPFFTTVARGVEDAASDAGFMVIVCNTDENEDEERKYMQMLLEKRVDGILLVPAKSGRESVTLAKRNNCPVVVVDRRIKNTDVDMVSCDSEQGAYLLGQELVKLGHKTLAMITGPKEVSTSVDRVSGCVNAFKEAGIDISNRIFYGEFTQDSGKQLTVKAMNCDPRPTALFAANNFIAIGALNALREMNLRVPEDVALVGFDDLPPAMVTFPFLTVAAQPAYDMGCKAVDVLLKRLNKEADGECRDIILPSEIIIRKSSGEKIA